MFDCKEKKQKKRKRKEYSMIPTYERKSYCKKEEWCGLSVAAARGQIYYNEKQNKEQTIQSAQQIGTASIL